MLDRTFFKLTTVEMGKEGHHRATELRGMFGVLPDIDMQPTNPGADLANTLEGRVERLKGRG